MKLLGIRKIKDGRFIKNYELTYLNKAGKEKVYELVSRNELKSPEDLGNKIAGVAIIATHKTEDKILLLKEFRMAINKEIINVVSGMIDKDESIEDCIRRELYEETGLTDITIKNILNPAYSAVGMSDEKVIVAFVEVDGEFEDNSSMNESIKPKFYSREEVKHLLETEEFASRTQIICNLWVNPF